MNLIQKTLGLDPSLANLKISPIFYMGNKRRLISQGLIAKFPKDISTFYDVFAGSAIVSMNVQANSYVLNDLDTSLIDLYQMFREYSSDEIIWRVEENIKEFGLPTERTKRNVYFDTDKIDEYKVAYNKLRERYNKNHWITDFYTLMFFSFSQMFRFNSDGDYNMPFGNDTFSEPNKQYIRNGCKFFSNPKVVWYNGDFRTLLTSIQKNLTLEDFLYFDPPYYITMAVYNERGDNKWGEAEELDLYQWLDVLNQDGIRWGLSNVVSNKDVRNDILCDWLSRNDYNIHHFESHTYVACGKGNSNADEVFITNYSTGVDKS